MKKRLPIFCLLLVVLLPLRAQDNPYEIENGCYDLFMRLEHNVMAPDFDQVNARFRERALEVGDHKAETLSYMEDLKHKARVLVKNGGDVAENDAVVDEAFRKLKAVSEEYGYKQYFYHAYTLTQTYYYNTGRMMRTMDLVREMQGIALERDDKYGLWCCDRYLITIYTNENDYVTAKKYILNSLDIYWHATDSTIIRQSPTRLYCDLADTYPIGDDSVRINVRKAEEYSKMFLDTLRVSYYKAKLAALDNDQDEYVRLRDIFLSSSMNSTVSPSGKVFFGLIDAVFDGTVMDRRDDIYQLRKVREYKYLANLCENNGYQDFAFSLEKHLVVVLEERIANFNRNQFYELDINMGKAALEADLDRTTHQVQTVTYIAMALLALLLLGIAVFLYTRVRIMRRSKAHDEEMIAELREANEKALAADAAKTRFVQNMSHEVRTPLNAIVGFSQLLSLPDGSFPEEEKEEFSAHIINNTKMLTMLLDDILNASAMDSGEYRINYEDGECHYMCKAAISSAEHRLQPGVTLTYEPEFEEPYTFRADPRRIQQILINLITNACKHTSKGWIKLSCSLTENPGMVTFSVTDTGPGVPPEKAEAIFDRFTKLNDFVQGTGLGLSICRDIAGKMGGNVWLDTAYREGGARFVFTVPVTPPLPILDE